MFAKKQAHVIDSWLEGSFITGILFKGLRHALCISIYLSRIVVCEIFHTFHTAAREWLWRWWCEKIQGNLLECSAAGMPISLNMTGLTSYPFLKTPNRQNHFFFQDLIPSLVIIVCWGPASKEKPALFMCSNKNQSDISLKHKSPV